MWPCLRLIVLGKATMLELRTVYSFHRMMQVNRAIDAHNEAEAEAHRRAQKKADAQRK